MEHTGSPLAPLTLREKLIFCHIGIRRLLCGNVVLKSRRRRNCFLVASKTVIILFSFFPALQSYIRSYATYPKDLKHIFHVRSLHLGHVAKSFGLRDAPHNLSQQLAGNPKKQKAMKSKRTDGRQPVRTKQRFSDLLTSEYSSGLPARPKKVKTPPSND
ncbi:ATP-dependent DNA helicase DDX31 [Rhinoderma darwinii]|uniref:ATP-dependent DNA helicase DDX31 n=1 Tax=Rhinoderma darwinii TaxID=43563 RepID=UPI003F6759A1